MDIETPSQWRLIGAEEAERILSEINWTKDDMGFFTIRHGVEKVRFARLNEDGSIVIDPLYIKPHTP